MPHCGGPHTINSIIMCPYELLHRYMPPTAENRSATYRDSVTLSLLPARLYVLQLQKGVFKDDGNIKGPLIIDFLFW